MIKRLIFDVDGTLINNVNFVLPIENTLKQIGIYSEKNVDRFLRAINTYESKFSSYNRNDYLSHFSKYLNVELNNKFINIFFKELKNCIPLNNQTLKNVISELSKKYELVLLTNYFKESQLNRLNNMGIGEFFLECHGEKLIKPNKDIYLKACWKNKPSEFVMIGDNFDLDIKVPKKLGIHTILVDSKHTLIDNKGIVVISFVEEINANLIKKIENN